MDPFPDSQTSQLDGPSISYALKVLLVGDQAIIGETVRRALADEEDGAEPLWHDGRKALDRLKIFLGV